MASSPDVGGPASVRPRGRPRSRPRPVEGTGATVDDIVAAAAALFAERGIHAVTMGDIAERAGLQQPSLYYYFRSKIDVLGHILDDVNRIPLTIVERARTSPGSVAVRLYWLIYQDVLAICRFPFDINEVHRLAGSHRVEFERYWAQRQRLNDEVEALVAAGVESGELRDVDPRLAALTLLANDEATQNWFRPVAGHRLHGRLDPALGDYSAEEVADHNAEMALRHLLVRPSAVDAARSRARALDLAD
ncbi:MAG: TetR/AcrR family transcriptional regulator [Actinomycetota bacterium]|nr:TetR/AcrR family transcriptional regulator [Actinomycetota bacterium]